MGAGGKEGRKGEGDEEPDELGKDFSPMVKYIVMSSEKNVRCESIHL